QEGRLARGERAQLQERRDGRLAVLYERVAERDQVVRARELARAVDVRHDAHATHERRRRSRAGSARSGDHRAPARRPRASAPDCATAPAGGRARPRPLRRRARRTPRAPPAPPPRPPPSPSRRSGSGSPEAPPCRSRPAALGERALEGGKRLAGRARLELATVKATALARVTGRPRGLDEREDRIA